MIRVLRWDAANRCAQSVDVADLPPAATLAGEQCYWVDVCAPTPAETDRVFAAFMPVHTLTRGDVAKEARGDGAHLPKVEEFPDYLFVITNPLPPDVGSPPPGADEAAVTPTRDRRLDQSERPQLAAVLTRTVLITHHAAPLDCVERAWAHASRHGDATRRGPDYLFHLVLDAMVDDYEPVVESIADRLDALETELFQRPTPAVLAHLLRLKRKVQFLRKTLVLEREVLARLIRGEFELIDDREMAYYRNVYDHLVRYAELTESTREMVSDLVQTHLSAASNRLNEVMKVLTMTSTVVLPMTLVAGVYGMNFDWMPALKSENGFYVACGLMALTAIGSLGYFRWRGWV